MSHHAPAEWPALCDRVRCRRASAASTHKGDFRNERVLEEDERETLIGWAENGDARG